MRDRILWVDCIGAILVGAVVFATFGMLSEWERIPVSVVLMMGAANLLYGCYSLFVTTRSPRPAVLVKVLAAANILWLPVCITISCAFWNQISGFGLLHVLGEGVYVASLGVTEWVMIDQLSSGS